MLKISNRLLINCSLLIVVFACLLGCQKDSGTFYSADSKDSGLDTLSPLLTKSLNLIEAYKNDSATIMLRITDSIAASYGNTGIQIDVLTNFGWMHLLNRDFGLSHEFYERAISKSKDLSDTLRWVRNLRQDATVYRSQSNYNQSVIQNEKALDLISNTKDSASLASVANSLGTVMVELKNYRAALDYYKTAALGWGGIGNQVNYTLAIHNQGDALRGMGNLEESLNTYKKALRLKIDLKRVNSSAYTLTGMGRTYLLMDSVERAEQVLIDAVKIRRSLSNKTRYAESLLILSRVSVAKKQYRKAESQLKEVEQIARDYNKADLLRDAFEDQRELYKTWGKYRKLAEVDDIYDIMTDSLYREEKLKVQEAQSAASLEREQQKTEIAEQDALLKTAERDAQSQKAESRLIVMIIAVLGLLVIGWQLLQIRKRNATLVTLNSRIKLITDNAFHSQKNALGLISALLRSKARQTNHEKELEVLKDVESKIEALGGVAKSLFQRRIEDNTAVAARVQLKTYLEELVDDTFSSVASKADLDLSVEDIETTSTEALNIGLITNEAVTNFSKYAESAGAETMLIRVTKQSEKLYLSFTDDGPGFPEGFDFSTSTGFGMQMMANLVDDMDGSISLNREDELTQIDIIVPLKA